MRERLFIPQTATYQQNLLQAYYTYTPLILKFLQSSWRAKFIPFNFSLHQTIISKSSSIILLIWKDQFRSLYKNINCNRDHLLESRQRVTSKSLQHLYTLSDLRMTYSQSHPILSRLFLYTLCEKEREEEQVIHDSMVSSVILGTENISSTAFLGSKGGKTVTPIQASL